MISRSPELIPSFYEKWCEGYEVVYGRRVRREASPFLQLAYKVFYRVFRNMSAVPIPVDAGDFSLLDAKVVHELGVAPRDQSVHPGPARVGRLQANGRRLPPSRAHVRRDDEQSSQEPVVGEKRDLQLQLRAAEFLTYAGWFLTMVAFLALIAQIVARLLWPNIPHGITTIIVLVLFFGGVQLLAVSILGEYIGKILEEAKQRPKFIRR